ncbi:MAG: glycosyltransferase [Novosphingobium sp.]
MSISVLTIVRNRAGHLGQLIEGLRRSDYCPDEFIVVDMNSEPPVSVSDLPFPSKVIRLSTEGLPLAAARNAAAAAATGDHLLFLDVDCIAMRGLVGAMTQALTRNDALVCAEVRYLGPDDARSDWEEAELMTQARGHPARQFPGSGMQRIDNPGLFWSLVFGIRRSRFEALGGFDQRFTGYGAEDTDFGFRARDANVSLLFMGGPGAFHQHHASFDPPLQHFRDIVRNAQVFHEKWGIWPMDGWLDAFAGAGLVDWNEELLTIRRAPTENEIRAAMID